MDNNFDDEFITFRNTMTINDIADLFELAKNRAGSEFITVLLYMSLQHFCINWGQCNYFLNRLMY